MIDAKERRRRQAAHDDATEAWSKTGRYARVYGLGDMIRSVGRSAAIRKVMPPEARKAKQVRHKARLREVRASNVHPQPWNPRKLDRSRYFPHQGEREIARRTRQMAA